MSARMYLFVDIRNEYLSIRYSFLPGLYTKLLSNYYGIEFERMNSRSFSLCYNRGYDVYVLLFSIVLSLSAGLMYVSRDEYARIETRKR